MSLLGKARNFVGINRNNVTGINKAAKIYSRAFGGGGFFAPLTDTIIDTVAPTSVTSSQQRSSISGGSMADNNAYGMTRDAWMTKDIVKDPMRDFNNKMAKWDTVQKIGQTTALMLVGGGVAGGVGGGGVGGGGVGATVPSFNTATTTSSVVPNLGTTANIIPNVPTISTTNIENDIQTNLTTPSQLPKDNTNTYSVIQSFQDIVPDVSNEFEKDYKINDSQLTINNGQKSIATTNQNDLDLKDDGLINSYNSIDFYTKGNNRNFFNNMIKLKGLNGLKLKGSGYDSSDKLPLAKERNVPSF